MAEASARIAPKPNSPTSVRRPATKAKGLAQHCDRPGSLVGALGAQGGQGLQGQYGEKRRRGSQRECPGDAQGGDHGASQRRPDDVGRARRQHSERVRLHEPIATHQPGQRRHQARQPKRAEKTVEPRQRVDGMERGLRQQTVDRERREAEAADRPGEEDQPPPVMKIGENAPHENPEEHPGPVDGHDDAHVEARAGEAIDLHRQADGKEPEAHDRDRASQEHAAIVGVVPQERNVEKMPRQVHPANPAIEALSGATRLSRAINRALICI